MVVDEGPAQHRADSFDGIAAPPAILADQPADLDISGVVGTLRIDPLEPAVAHELAGVALDQEQEAETLALVKVHRFAVLLLDRFQRKRPTQMVHDRRRVEQAELQLCIARLYPA